MLAVYALQLALRLDAANRRADCLAVKLDEERRHADVQQPLIDWYRQTYEDVTSVDGRRN
ncbi:MAG: hypothetical protein AAGI71_03135 [Bacteroidota bacterium]